MQCGTEPLEPSQHHHTAAAAAAAASSTAAAAAAVVARISDSAGRRSSTSNSAGINRRSGNTLAKTLEEILGRSFAPLEFEDIAGSMP